MRQVFNKKLLSLAVCSVVAGVSSPAIAQGDQDMVLEEIVVTGMRNSLRNAQDLKREASTVVDAITASDIGALPDKSVTEALQRVPGVTIERFAASDDPNHFADEGTGVLIRGLDRVRSEINGRDAFSANPFGGLNFEDIPPELLGAVEVYKNQTADMIAGGVAGTVNLVTRKPFDSDGRVAGFTVKGNYGDRREEFSPSASALFSDIWETDIGDFGFQLSASHSELRTTGDGIGVANFYSRGDSFINVPPAWDASGEVLGSPAPDSPVDGPAVAGQEPGTVVHIPGQFSLRRAENDRERTGFAGALQWRNVDRTIQTTLEYVRSDASLTYRENVLGAQAQGFDAAIRVQPNVGTAVEPTYDANGFFTSGIITVNNDHPFQASTRFNETETSVEDLSFNVQYNPTDRVTLELDVQRVESTETVTNNGINPRYWGGLGSAYLDLTGSYPYIEFLNHDRMIDPQEEPHWSEFEAPDFLLASGLDQHVDSKGTLDAYKFDLEYDLDHDWARSVRVGVYHSDRELVVRDTEYANWGTFNIPWELASAVNGDYRLITEEFESQTWNNFFKNGHLGGGNEFLFIKMESAEDFLGFARRSCEEGFNTGAFGGGANNENGQNNPNCFLASQDMGGRIAEGSPFAPHDVTSTNETRNEAYVRFDFADDSLDTPYRGNVGLRYVNYQLESTGFVVLPDLGGEGSDFIADERPNLAAFADGQGQRTTVSGTDYTAVLPSFNLAVDLTDDVVLRFGASQGLYFPTLQNTRNSRIVNLGWNNIREEEDGPVVGIDNVQLNGTARNPFLEPEKSTNLDVSTEWYFADTGSVSLALFYKNIDNLFRERPFRAEVENPRTNVSEEVSFTGPANDGSGSIQGFEFSYTQFFDALPGAWSGLGMQFNYTFIDQNDLEDPESSALLGEVRFDSAGNPVSDDRNSFRAFTDLPLPGYSDQNFNLVGMYEYNAISARLAYTWRSDYLVTRRDSNEFAPIYAKSSGYLDGSIYYDITSNVQVGFEASNILNTITETQAQYNQEGVRTDALNFRTDRRLALSLRASF
ncbi:TonB-dependent receptor [Marinimicrobium alkaliphilum]|uniref:TonB-dependent receptor n=1 Tax=Marinimicrobium alkaliphilum TaxID=2202654 RepID=UPI000DB9ED75|nr:TonB-dependent receptor [Marinimicrobium alkaliphilum]